MSAIKQSFIKGTMILLVAGIVNRILGFVPRIWLPRVIGAEGMGLYQMGYPFLIVLLAMITGGIPLAVAKLVAEADSAGDERRVRRILRVSLTLSMGLGLSFMTASLFLSRWLTDKLFTDERVYMTFLAMSPILVLVSVSAVYRGYFQGRRNMIPTAVSQLTETVFRIGGQLILASALLPYGVEYAAAGAMAGVVIGEIGGMLALLRSYARTKAAYAALPASQRADGEESGHAGTAPAVKEPSRTESVWSRLIRIALPVTGGRIAGSASYFLESIAIVQSLAIAGVATSAATAQYGMLQGMVIPLLLMPTALTYSLSVSLVPSLSEAAARGDMRTIHKRLHQSMRLALVSGAPFAVILFVLAEPLCYFLYQNADAGHMLRMMSPVALLLYLQSPLQAALQALDRPGTALINTLIGAVVKLALIYELASRPDWGIYGAITAICVNIAFVTLLHWGSVARLLRFSLPPSDFFKVGAGMALMAGAVAVVMGEPWTHSPALRFAAACAAGAAVYLFCLFALKLVDREDFIRIPWLGPKLQRWL
ncbi:stage V sporulation protein B [Paenibacillus thermoaerophilus]|uniref:Stage V sporulation protein B n=1 Tax=Paenibacillus thermoaerophilus TaxID=1215385 RepID=A0ABW2UYW8_9BACL|nr:stage V sporulation protein B [Paenibacillus thermoaerophilus]